MKSKISIKGALIAYAILISTLAFLLFFSDSYIDYPYSLQELTNKKEQIETTMEESKRRQQEITTVSADLVKKQQKANTYQEYIHLYEDWFDSLQLSFNYLRLMTFLEEKAEAKDVDILHVSTGSAANNSDGPEEDEEDNSSDGPEEDEESSFAGEYSVASRTISIEAEGDFLDVKTYLEGLEKFETLSLDNISLISNDETVIAYFNINVYFVTGGKIDA